MRAKAVLCLGSVKTALPYLWGFAAAAALDYLVDVQTLFVPAVAGAAVVSAACVVIWRTRR
jgi:hypothetical protein